MVGTGTWSVKAADLLGWEDCSKSREQRKESQGTTAQIRE